MAAEKLRISAFADRIGLDEAELYRRLSEFNRTESETKLTPRYLQRVRKEGLSLQAGKLRELLREFLSSEFASDVSMKSDDLDGFFDSFGQSSREPNPDPSLLLASTDSDIFRTLMLLQKARDSNASLKSTRSAFAGHYKIVRRTSRPKEDHFYEEPFFLGDQGHQSFMIAEKQDVRLGFTVASSGISNTFLFGDHTDRTLGVTVVTLFSHGDASANALPGLVSRFSDDKHRPTTCSVLARRIDAGELTDMWDSAVEGVVSMGPNPDDLQELRKLQKRARDFVVIVDSENDPEKLHKSYLALGLKAQVKAPLADEWDKQLSSAELSDDVLSALRAAPVLPHRVR